MQVQPNDEQKLKEPEYLTTEVYESIGPPDNNLLPLLEKYDRSFNIDWDDSEISIFSNKLGIEIIGIYIGSLIITPPINSFSKSDCYTNEVWGYRINYSNSGTKKETQEKITDNFFEELQDVFSEVGIIKEIIWDNETIATYLMNKKYSLFTLISLIPSGIISDTVSSIYLERTINDYYNTFKLKFELDETSYYDIIILDMFDTIYNQVDVIEESGEFLWFFEDELRQRKELFIESIKDTMQGLYSLITRQQTSDEDIRARILNE